MNFFSHVMQDWSANKGNTKGRIIILFFRIGNYASSSKVLKYVFLPYLILYKICAEWILTIEIPYSTQIGEGFKLVHGQGLVINSQTKIGDNVTIRHNTTIGNSVSGGKSPIIGSNVTVGANSVIIGNITIGNNSIIGAGSVVVKDVLPYSVVGGNPAKVIKTFPQSI